MKLEQIISTMLALYKEVAKLRRQQEKQRRKDLKKRYKKEHQSFLVYDVLAGKAELKTSKGSLGYYYTPSYIKNQVWYCQQDSKTKDRLSFLEDLHEVMGNHEASLNIETNIDENGNAVAILWFDINQYDLDGEFKDSITIWDGIECDSLNYYDNIENLAKEK